MKNSAIVDYYQKKLSDFGDTHEGLGWPNYRDTQLRHWLMLDMIPKFPTNPISLVDIGCGTGDLHTYIKNNELSNIKYTGIDISDTHIKIAKEKHPDGNYYCLDILEYDDWGRYDFAILNGLFTVKSDLTQVRMDIFLKAMISEIYSNIELGCAFNVMSKNVEWERDDLYHLSLDGLTKWITSDISRNFSIRQDYGLYEYTCAVYKHRNTPYIT